MNKNIVITGSTKGIGLEMAKKFLEAGCKVTISGRKSVMNDELLQILNKYKDKYIYVQCDVKDKDNLQKLWDVSQKKWSTVDIWINNAGVNVPHKNVWETDICYTENMLKQKSGAIYSMEGLGSNNMWQVKTILYGTTKCALTYFMIGLAKELKESGIIVGRLSPGMMLTDFITKGPEGEESLHLENNSFKKIFNILGDKPETVAEFFIPKILKNSKNGKRIAWLTNTKTMIRFISAPFHKRKLI